MQLYEVEDYLTGAYVLMEYNKEHIEHILDMLSPHSVALVILSKQYQHLCDRTEKWFGTKFGVQDIPEAWTTCPEVI